MKNHFAERKTSDTYNSDKSADDIGEEVDEGLTEEIHRIVIEGFEIEDRVMMKFGIKLSNFINEQ